MAEPTKTIAINRPPFVNRVLQNDATKKGAAALMAGVLVAVVTEALWPTE